ncbi:hypothetical protein A4A49_32335 [Nicotiana attenuata]|uniref:Uncharacterized protein n=1 Tax=Nicotiana attenuata TaxID=49451 RepID=A0A1J6KSB8_NICAT|nr:hypothetical protein A4A49_32335 [Nicotiana attenuata]
MLLEEERDGSEPIMNDMATLMLRKFKKYWRSYSKILSLDHVTTDAKVKVVEDHLQLLFNEYLVPSTSISLSGEHVYGRNINEARDGLEEFDVFENQLESGRDKTQLHLYLEEPNLDRKVNPNLDVLVFLEGK